MNSEGGRRKIQPNLGIQSSLTCDTTCLGFEAIFRSRIFRKTMPHAKCHKLLWIFQLLWISSKITFFYHLKTVHNLVTFIFFIQKLKMPPLLNFKFWFQNLDFKLFKLWQLASPSIGALSGLRPFRSSRWGVQGSTSRALKWQNGG